MKYIDSVTQYGGIILQTWLYNDGFTFIVHESEEMASIAIQNDQGLCTECLYKRFINQYNGKYDMTFGGAMPPTIKCKKTDLETVMKLLESIDKNHLYFEDVR